MEGGAARLPPKKARFGGGRKCLANRQRVKKGEVWNYELEGVVNVMGFMEDKGLIGQNTRHKNERENKRKEKMKYVGKKMWV